MEANWYDTYYDDLVKEAQHKKEEITSATCGHTDCFWDICPKCGKRTMHKFMTVRNMAIVDIERCENLSCGALSEKSIKKF